MASGSPVAMTTQLDGFKTFKSDVSSAKSTLNRQMAVQMQASANLVADDYRRAVAGHSQRVAASIQTRVNGYIAEVFSDDPFAAALENGGNSGTFQHPTYGHMDRMVDQDAAPAAIPALINNQDAIVGLIDKAVSAWGQAAGFY
jgi:prophage DNA circulation protein